MPEGGQLVILSKGGMAMLLGDQTLSALANYFTCDEDEKCMNLLLMEQSFVTLAMNKREDAPVTITSKSSGPPPLLIHLFSNSKQAQA